MSRRRISLEDKQRIITCYERHDDYFELADALSINRRSAYSIICRYIKDGQVSRNRGGAHNTIVDEEMKDTAVSIVEDHPEYTIDQINTELRLRLPQKRHVCNNTISNALHCRLITLKLTRDPPEERNSQIVKAARKGMAEWLLQHGDLEKVYVDESAFRLWIKRSYGRSSRGQRAVRVVNARGSGHMSVIFAVSNVTGLVNHEFVEGGFRSDRFNVFLETCSNILANRNVVFIFDNASSHNRAYEANLQAGHGYMFQPPYFPFLNICEGCFSIWKTTLKRSMAEVREQLLTEQHPNRVATMMQLAEQAISSVTLPKVSNLVSYMLSVLPRCILEEDIFTF